MSSPARTPPLHRLTLLSAVVLALGLAGCASSPPGSGATPPAAGSAPAGPSSTVPSASPAPTPAATAPAAAPVPVAPVALPAAAARKLVLTMTGPEQVTKAKDWADFQREWRDTLADHAKAAGIAFSMADVAPAPGGEEGTLVTVQVADYRIVSIGMRIMFGIMTGNAFIDARVRYSSLRDGSVFGEQAYSTSSSAAHGVFAKVTPQQVDQIATSVIQQFKAARQTP